MTPEELDAVQRLVDLVSQRLERWLDNDDTATANCHCWQCRWQREVKRACLTIPDLKP
jgi:hypothetical protein